MKDTIRFLENKPFITFLPFLIFYCIFVACSSYKYDIGDAPRYLQFADNLLHGFYSDPQDINLWNGPGYPLILVPFVALKQPLWVIATANAFFMYFSVVYVYKAVYLFKKTALAFCMAALWGCYYPAIAHVPAIITESFAFFLISLFGYCVLQYSKSPSVKRLICSSAVLAFLILVKVAFAYVAVCMLAISVFLCLVKTLRLEVARYAYVCLLSLVFCIPYLVYTYSLTGKFFCWATSSGAQLIWLTSPYPDELGDWLFVDCKSKNPILTKDDFAELLEGSDRMEAINRVNWHFLYPRHKNFFDATDNMPQVEADKYFKEVSIANIKENPLKFVKNYVANITRMFFYTGFSDLSIESKWYKGVYTFPNAVLFTALLAVSIITVIRLRGFDATVLMLAITFFVYFGGSSLVSALPRQLSLGVPLVVIWVGYVLGRYVRIAKGD